MHLYTRWLLLLNLCILYTANETFPSADSSNLSMGTLKRETKVTDEQLDTSVEEVDLPKLSSYFDNTDDYVEMLGLSPGQQTDVIEEKARTAMNRTQAGIKLALKYWLNRVLAEGTFRALLLILLSLDKGDVAINVAQYLSAKGEYNLATNTVTQVDTKC